MTEQELEKLFKSKLAAGNYPYNPAAWNAMENLLDQNAVRGGGYFWRAAAAILAFALIIGSLSFWKTSQQVDALPVVDLNTLDEVLILPIENEQRTEKSTTDGAIALERIATDRIVASNPNSEVDPATSIDDKEAVTSKKSSPVDPAIAAPTSAAYALAETKDPEFLINDNKESQAILALNNKDIGDPVMAIKNETRSPVAMESKSFHRARQALYLKGGTVLNEAHNNSSMGVGFHLGVEYQIGLAKSLDLSAGLTYSQINKLGIHQTFDSTFYNFSSERVETEITGSQLNYLEMPISLHWRFHPRHQIGVGAYAALLLSVSEEVEKRHYTQNGEMNVDRHSDEGMLSPYENYDMGLGFSYFYMVDRQFEIGLEVRRGLVDVTKDTESVYVQNHQNLNTRLSLRYRIL